MKRSSNAALNLVDVSSDRVSVAQPVFNGREKEYVDHCLDTGWISSAGEYIEKFEKQFAVHVQANHAIACFNGTVALHLALLAKGVTAGDEVIVPSLTYIATANVVRYCGATPVFVDCEADTWNIDPRMIEERISDRTKGIIVVHLYGAPVDMDPVMELAKRRGLFVIEDAAQAHGSKYRGKPVGALGDAGTFSFFGNKIITTGEGGMITTNRTEIDQSMRLFRNQGMSPKKRYWFEMIGYNYRMTNLQAAIGCGQLEGIDWHLNRRQEVVKAYREGLKGLDEIITLPVEKPYATHCYWMFTVLISDKSRVNRDALILKLDQDGIETRPIFYPMFMMPPYAENADRYPVAASVGIRGISLPTHGALSSSDISRVCERVRYHCKGE